MLFKKSFFLYGALLLLSITVKAQADKTSRENKTPVAFSLEAGTFYYLGALNSKIDAGYSRMLSPSIYLGGSLGLETKSSFKRRLLAATTFQYYFKEKGSSPFLEAEANAGLLFLDTSNPYWIYSSSLPEKEWITLFTGGARVYLGYLFYKPEKKIGFSCKLGYGLSLEKQLESYTGDGYNLSKVLPVSQMFALFGVVHRIK